MTDQLRSYEVEPATPRPPLFYSVPAAAELIGTAPVTLYRAIRNGEFPALRVRGRLVVPVRALDEMITTAVADRVVVDTASWCARRAADAGSPEAG